MLRPIRIFAIATLVPVALLALGGLWASSSWRWIIWWQAPCPRPRRGRNFPQPMACRWCWRLPHFALLPLALWSVSGAGGQDWPARITLFFGFGLFFGQISNSNTHELIHRSRAGLFRLEMWVYVTLLFGHHTSAHRLVHHRHVATRQDPNSARGWRRRGGCVRAAWRGDRSPI